MPKVLGNTLFIRQAGHSHSQPTPKGGELGDVVAHCHLQAVPSLGLQGLTVLLGLFLSREEFSPIRPEVYVLALRVTGGIGKAHGCAVACCLGNLGDFGVELIVSVGLVIARVKVRRLTFGNIVGRG